MLMRMEFVHDVEKQTIRTVIPNQTTFDPGSTIQELARENGLPIPEALSQVQQVLLMPVHVMIQAYSVKGGQYKYSGHCCNFTHDIANIVTKVPQLPEDIDIIIIHSKSDDDVAEQVTSRQLHDAFQV